jgi:5-methyltetrahydrofolate--homocysteine methyltransferase
MTATFLDALKSRILVGDGAMGTELISRGLEPGACPDAWNLDHPDRVLDVLRAYRDAGAATLITNTFGANRWKLSGFGLESKLHEINVAAAKLARKAAGKDAFVLGDVGPTGRFMEPLGVDGRCAFVDVFAEQAAALAEGGADAIILETFTSLDEILAGVEAAKATGLPVIASMSFARDAAGTFHTIMGNGVADSARALDKAGADVIAANCGLGAQEYAEITRELASATTKPVMVQPNAGMPQLIGGRTVFPMTPAEFASYVPALVEAGARVIGGCCGATPDHIRAVRAALSRL